MGYYEIGWYRAIDFLICYNIFFLGGYMKYLFTFLFCFTVVYLFYTLIIVVRKKGFEKFKTSKQLDYFRQAYKIDFDKVNLKVFANAMAITNAFIIAITCTIIEFFDNFILKMVVGFVVLVPLMLLMYKIVGMIFKKKEGK